MSKPVREYVSSLDLFGLPAVIPPYDKTKPVKPWADPNPVPMGKFADGTMYTIYQQGSIEWSDTTEPHFVPLLITVEEAKTANVPTGEPVIGANPAHIGCPMKPLGPQQKLVKMWPGKLPMHPPVMVWNTDVIEALPAPADFQGKVLAALARIEAKLP